MKAKYNVTFFYFGKFETQLQLFRTAKKGLFGGVVQAFFAAYPVPALRYQPPPGAANVPLRLTGHHFPEPAGGRPDCKVCSDRAAGKRKQTQWQCKTCKVAMCIYPCFERYHTVKHYK